jgi:hypothetical protein
VRFYAVRLLGALHVSVNFANPQWSIAGNLNRIDLETPIGRHEYENLENVAWFWSRNRIGYLGTGRVQ